MQEINKSIKSKSVVNRNFLFGVVTPGVWLLLLEVENELVIQESLFFSTEYPRGKTPRQWLLRNNDKKTQETTNRCKILHFKKKNEKSNFFQFFHFSCFSTSPNTPNTCSDVLKAAFSYSLRSFTCRLPLTNQTWTHLRLFGSVCSTILFLFTMNSLTCFWDEAKRL